MGLFVTNLYVYPVKSLSPQRLDKVCLEVGGSFPYDRAYALKKPGWEFDRGNPEYKAKTNFHVLMQNERLAALKSFFDTQTGILTLKSETGEEISASLESEAGRASVEKFLKGFLGQNLELIESPGFSFSDVPMKVASIINLESVKDLSKKVGAPLDPLRFRGNIQVDGAEAWTEFDLLDKTFRIGEVVFKTIKRISRCAATNVNLKTAERDQNLPKALIKAYGHFDMGIYAKVIQPGTLRPGDKIETL